MQNVLHILVYIEVIVFCIVNLHLKSKLIFYKPWVYHQWSCTVLKIDFLTGNYRTEIALKLFMFCSLPNLISLPIHLFDSNINFVSFNSNLQPSWCCSRNKIQASFISNVAIRKWTPHYGFIFVSILMSQAHSPYRTTIDYFICIYTKVPIQIKILWTKMGYTSIFYVPSPLIKNSLSIWFFYWRQ